jgi:hypothetical protein
MAQIMEVDQWQPSGSQGGQPDSLPKVPPQRAIFRAREQQGVIVRLSLPFNLRGCDLGVSRTFC